MVGSRIAIAILVAGLLGSIAGGVSAEKHAGKRRTKEARMKSEAGAGLELTIRSHDGTVTILTQDKDLLDFTEDTRYIQFTADGFTKFREAAHPGGSFVLRRDGKPIWKGDLVASTMSRTVELPVINVQPVPGEDPGDGRARIDLSYPRWLKEPDAKGR